MVYIIVCFFVCFLNDDVLLQLLSLVLMNQISFYDDPIDSVPNRAFHDDKNLEKNLLSYGIDVIMQGSQHIHHAIDLGCVIDLIVHESQKLYLEVLGMGNDDGRRDDRQTSFNVLILKIYIYEYIILL
eukprot:UN00144